MKVRMAGVLAIAGALTACTVAPRETSQRMAGAWGAAAAPESLSALIQRSAPAVVGIAEMSAGVGGTQPAVIGSGFRIAGTPWIATAAHVVAGLRGAPRVVWNGQPWPARVVRVDEQADLALLALDGPVPLPGLALAADDMAVPGDGVLVLGCPFGTLPTATAGIVSALPGAVLEPPALRQRMQLNAAVNPGNSGGPVLDLQGRVIGVANATVPGGYGLGFAVPVAALRRLVSASGA